MCELRCCSARMCFSGWMLLLWRYASGSRFVCSVTEEERCFATDGVRWVGGRNEHGGDVLADSAVYTPR
jgi:hypothetical protein